MLFSKENRRFTVLVGAITVLAVTTLIMMTSLIENEKSTSTAVLTGFTGVLMVQLIAMLRSEMQDKNATQHRENIEGKLETAANASTLAATKAKEVADVVKTIKRDSGANLVNAIDKVATHVREAERDQLFQSGCNDQAAMLKLVEEVSNKICSDHVKNIAVEAARAVIAELKAERALHQEEKKS